jgi:hypothetical protein
VPAQHLGERQHQVGGRDAGPQRAGEAHADHDRQAQHQRLAEHHGLGLDAADAPAEDAEAVDHRGVGVGADEGVGHRDVAALVVGQHRHDLPEVLEVDLVDDAHARRDDPEVAERALGPAQELVALAVALVLAVDVLRVRAREAERVDLHRVVDHQVALHQRVDLCGVEPGPGHRGAHRREVDHRGHAGEVLQQHPGGRERHHGLGRRGLGPAHQRLDVGLRDVQPADLAEQVLEQDLDRERQRGRVAEPELCEAVEAVVGGAVLEQRPRPVVIGSHVARPSRVVSLWTGLYPRTPPRRTRGNPLR